jgi:hypothetical protein
VTVKGVRFDNHSSYGIAGLGSVNLDADSGNARIDADQGAHQFQVVVNLHDDVDADIAAGASLAFDNQLSLSGHTLAKTGGGELSINNNLNSGLGAILGQAGTISGTGTVGGDLNNATATVAPGSSLGVMASATPGRTRVTGDSAAPSGQSELTVPEPSGLWLLGLAVTAAIGLFDWRRRDQRLTR